MEASVKMFLVFGVEAITVINKDFVNSTIEHKLKHNQMSWQRIGNMCYCSDNAINKQDW